MFPRIATGERMVTGQSVSRMLYKPVFLKLWSAAALQVVRGDLQAVSEEKVLQKLYQTGSNEKYSNTCPC
jgi:hypothetical protein